MDVLNVDNREKPCNHYLTRLKSVLIILIIGLLFQNSLNAQDTIQPENYKIFYYPNGLKSSEGTMRDGNPDGYWKTYYETGILKSEGNRRNFQIDSLWKFYDLKGNLSVMITYKNGLQNGPRTTYLSDKTIVENFENNIKSGLTSEYYPSGKLWKTVNYVNGVEDGLMITYSEDGRIIQIEHYQKGFLKNREFINRLNDAGQKSGIWKEFWPGDSYITKSEIPYREGEIDGYSKYYDADGNLQSIQKYVNGVLIVDPPELAEYELRMEYYSDGSIKTATSYKDNLPEGVRRHFDKEGKIIQSYIYYQGRIIGKGIVDENGFRQGAWQEYYLSGRLQAEGTYTDNVKTGLWKFYFENGNLEQIGSFDDKGRSKGNWKWYYPDGKIRRTEMFFEDVNEGEMVEFANDSSIIAKGTYVSGSKEGTWIESVNGFRDEGEYLDDVRDGYWKSFYPNGNPYFEGKFIDDLADGIHIWYYEDGKVKEKGNYSMGLRNGEWRYFDEEGKLIITVEFSNGVEVKYDTKKIEPEINTQELRE